MIANLFQVDSFRDSKHIGNDQIDHKEEYMTYERYPIYMRNGCRYPQMYHRRPVLSPIDGYAMMIAKLGSGSNLLGYYVFAGANESRGEFIQMRRTEEPVTGVVHRLSLTISRRQ
jgi:hypothetical protein